jgi:hypothetical protein
MIRHTSAGRLFLFVASAWLTIPLAPQSIHAQVGRGRPVPAAEVEQLEQLAAERDKLMKLMDMAAKLRAAGGEQLADAERAAAAQIDHVYDVLSKLLLATGREGVVDTIKGLRQLQDARIVDLLKQNAEASLAVEKSQRELKELTLKLAESESRNALPPLEEADIKVFSLRHVNAVQAAQTIDSLLGPGPVRVAVDERTNSLIVAGKSESLTVIEALLMRLDEQAGQSDEASAVAAEAQRATRARSLLLRVFWLADGLAEDEGKDPAEFLPASVTKALERLGLNNPRIVTQTVNSLAHAVDTKTQFHSRVPVVLHSTPVELKCSGQLESLSSEQVKLLVEIILPTYQIEASGSLVTPLGHYTVLGTANSVMADPAAARAMNEERRRMMEEERRRMEEEGGGFGGGRGGYGGAQPAAIDPLTGMPIGAEGAPQPTETKYNTSHFAFVVQVIEGESFPAEE